MYIMHATFNSSKDNEEKNNCNCRKPNSHASWMENVTSKTPFTKSKLPHHPQEDFATPCSTYNNMHEKNFSIFIGREHVNSSQTVQKLEIFWVQKDKISAKSWS